MKMVILKKPEWVYLFIGLWCRPHSHVSGNNTFAGWFLNISGFMSYKRQPSREIKSIPACVLISDTFLGLLTTFPPFFFFFSIMWHQNSVFLLNKNVYFTTVLWSVHYYFRVTMATVQLWLLHVCQVEFQQSYIINSSITWHPHFPMAPMVPVLSSSERIQTQNSPWNCTCTFSVHNLFSQTLWARWRKTKAEI